MNKRGLGDWIALAGLVLTLFTGTLIFYGRFASLETRQDEADRDRHEMMANEQAMSEQLNRIEQSVARIEASQLLTKGHGGRE
jgi:hypothetical protein